MRTKTKPTTKPPRAKRVPKAKPAPAAAPTREGLLAEMALLLDAVDKFMAERPEPRGNGDHASTNWRPYDYSNTPFRVTKDKLWDLYQRLDKLLRGPLLDEGEAGAREAVRDAFETKPGEPLTWARPGSALLWLGDIPVRAAWGGVFDPEGTGLYALDSRRMFFGASGFRSISVYMIPRSLETPVALYRAAIRFAPDAYSGRYDQPALELLSDEGRVAVQAFMADPANAWWRNAIKQAPVDPLPLPSNLPAVQTRLFD